MGAGASVEADVSPEEAEKLAGDCWNADKFELLACDGNIPADDWNSMVKDYVRFVYSPGFSIACKGCGAILFEGKRTGEGHNWNDKPASTFAPATECKLADEGDKFCINGDCEVANVCCSECSASIGWKYIESGEVGCQLPDVDVNDMELKVVGDLQPQAAPDDLDTKALALMKEKGILGMQATFQMGDNAPVSRAWGYVNKDGVIMEPETPMRIASVSKPITGVAVLKLVEQGKIELDAEILPLVEQKYDRSFEVCDERVKSVTVRQCLYHLGGFSKDPDDPMFLYPEMAHEQLIEKILADLPLGTDPGTNYDYSNFGYCLLGRAIEQASGKTYEEYVQQEVFAPCGITEARLASPDNVEDCGYYLSTRDGSDLALADTCIDTPLVARMDAHGGWVMNAPDLVKFNVGLQKGDIISEDMRGQMLTLDNDASVSNSYGMGWACNDSGTRWHAGALEGTGSLLVWSSDNDGMCWAAIVNAGHGCDALDGFLWSCVEDVQALTPA